MYDVDFDAQSLSVKDVSELIGVSTQTLRNWEAFFTIPIERNEHGQRQYTENTLKLFKEINRYAKRGLKLQAIKPLLDMRFEPSSGCQGQIEIIADNNSFFESNHLKPFLKQITEFKEEVRELRQENKEINKLNAKLEERINNKDEIICFKDSIINDKNSQLEDYKARLQELESKLNRKWWNFFLS